MDKLELIQKRAAALKTMKDIHAKAERENRGLEAAEQDVWDKADEDFHTYHRMIRLLDANEYLAGEEERDALKSAKIVNGPKREQRNFIGEAAVRLATGKNYGWMESRATFDTTAGSATIQDPLIQDQFISKLIAPSLLNALGVPQQQRDNHSSWPAITALPATSWFSEGDSLSDTKPTITSRDVSFKDLSVLTRVSRQLLSDAPDLTARIVEDAIATAFAQQFNQVFLYGASGSAQPVGLDNISGTASYDYSGTLLSDYTPVIRGVKELLNNSVPIENIHMIVGTDVAARFEDLQDGNTNPMVAPSWIARMMENGRYHISNEVLSNYGTGNDEERIYLVDPSALMWVYQPTVTLRLVERYAEYMEVAFLSSIRCDLVALRPDNICIIEGIADAS